MSVAFERGTYARPDGAVLATYAWVPQAREALRGVVYLAHGMAEHAGRYDEFARYLNGRGYAVYAHDHRGHGLTATGDGRDEPLGHVAETGGWDLMVGDLMARVVEVAALHPGGKLVLVGHSMGSFLARDVAIRLSLDEARFTHGARLLQPIVDIAAYVFVGTGGPKGAMLGVGRGVAGLLGRVMGLGTPSTVMDRVLFGEYNRAFAPARTDFDWLSRDPAAVDDYVADPLCGFVCSNAFYRDLLAGVGRVNTPANLTTLSPRTPVLFIAGDADGVGDFGKGVRAAAAALRDAGLTDVTCVLYREARHELLNETNKEVVMSTITDWLDARTAETTDAGANS
ncbi:MAG: alpha/beta fold hydrolase [Dermatophilus congolensis]|nr:alpha/beta fold hydrolase [Dermatophilus congolensis]